MRISVKTDQTDPSFTQPPFEFTYPEQPLSSNEDGLMWYGLEVY